MKFEGLEGLIWLKFDCLTCQLCEVEKFLQCEMCLSKITAYILNVQGMTHESWFKYKSGEILLINPTTLAKSCINVSYLGKKFHYLSISIGLKQ